MSAFASLSYDIHEKVVYWKKSCAPYDMCSASYPNHLSQNIHQRPHNDQQPLKPKNGSSIAELLRLFKPSHDMKNTFIQKLYAISRGEQKTTSSTFPVTSPLLLSDHFQCIPKAPQPPSSEASSTAIPPPPFAVSSRPPSLHSVSPSPYAPSSLSHRP